MTYEWSSEEYDDCIIMPMHHDYNVGDIINDKGIDYEVVDVDMTHQAMLMREKLSAFVIFKEKAGVISKERC